MSGKKIIEAGSQAVVEHEVTDKVVVIKSDNVDPASYGRINESVKDMGARGALIVGAADEVQVIDPCDRFVVLIAKDLPSEEAANVLTEILQENGAIGFMAVPTPAHILALSDEDLERLNLRRINDRRKDA